jgi:hypothetical protein
MTDAVQGRSSWADVFARNVGDAIGAFATQLVAPTLRELEEAGSEVADAGRRYVETERSSAERLRTEVADAWNSQPTPERAVVVAGWRALQEAIRANVERTRAGFDVGREVVEGAVEVALANPGATAMRLAGEQVVEGARQVGRHVVDRAIKGAEGGVRAARVVAETHAGIVGRSVDQQRRNAEGIGRAFTGVHQARVDGMRQLHDEVAAAWRDQPTIERRLVVAGYEVVENSIRNSIRDAEAQADVVRSIGQAAVENVVTGVRNLGDVIGGNVRAAGELLGGLFGR